MSQFSTTSQGATLTFDSQDWIEGLSLNGRFNGVTFTTPAIGRGAEQITNMNPFTAYGILEPGRGATNVHNNSLLSGVVVSGVIQSGQFGYVIDGAAKIQQYDYTAPAVNGFTNGLSPLGTTFPHQVAGTTPVGQDMVVYKHLNSGNTYFSVFYSYYNHAGTPNWNVGALLNVTGQGGFTPTFDDTFMTATASTPMTTGDSQDVTQVSSPHCLEIGSDDILYIGSGRYVHGYDGSSDTFQSKLVTLPLGFTIVALKKYQDVFLIVGNYDTDTTNNIGGNALMYIWNYLDQDITQAIDLEDPFVTSLFLWKGVPYITTVGEIEGRGINKLKALIGNNVTLQNTFDLTPPVNRGIDPSSNVLYINCGGKVIQIGDPFTGRITPTNQTNICVSVGTSGWIKNLGVDLTTGINYGLVASSATAFSGGTNSLSTFLTNWTTGLYLQPYSEIPTPAGKKARLTNIIVENYRAYSTADTSLFINYDFGSAQSSIFINQSSITTPLTKQYRYDTSGNPLKSCTNIGFEMVWGGLATASALPPAISRLTFVFEYLDLSANT